MEVFTEKNAVGDGDTVTGSRVAARDITIRAKSRGGIKNAILRARAVVFFDPQYTYDVDISYDGVTRTARDCRLRACAPMGIWTERAAWMAWTSTALRQGLGGRMCR